MGLLVFALDHRLHLLNVCLIRFNLLLGFIQNGLDDAMPSINFLFLYFILILFRLILKVMPKSILDNYVILFTLTKLLGGRFRVVDRVVFLEGFLYGK